MHPIMHHYWSVSHHGLLTVGLLGFGLKLAFLILLGIVLICLYRRHLRNQAVQAPPTALDILMKRYAKGEINQEDYTIMKEKLK
jgi:uncharacterized membrane protein